MPCSPSFGSTWRTRRHWSTPNRRTSASVVLSRYPATPAATASSRTCRAASTTSTPLWPTRWVSAAGFRRGTRRAIGPPGASFWAALFDGRLLDDALTEQWLQPAATWREGLKIGRGFLHRAGHIFLDGWDLGVGFMSVVHRNHGEVRTLLSNDPATALPVASRDAESRPRLPYEPVPHRPRTPDRADPDSVDARLDS